MIAELASIATAMLVTLVLFGGYVANKPTKQGIARGKMTRAERHRNPP